MNDFRSLVSEDSVGVRSVVSRSLASSIARSTMSSQKIKFDEGMDRAHGVGDNMSPSTLQKLEYRGIDDKQWKGRNNDPTSDSLLRSVDQDSPDSNRSNISSGTVADERTGKRNGPCGATMAVNHDNLLEI